MQKAYLMALYDLAQNDPNVLSVLADSGTGYDELFRRDFPKQLLDFGIAEEHMVAAAAGMATCGKIPFVYTAGAFLAYRSIEFIRNDICLQNLNVKVVGMGSGLSWCTLGPTHHTTEDVSMLRAIPGLTIFSPSCPREVEKVVKAAYDINGPVYIRIGMNAEPDIYGSDYSFETGKNIVLEQGKDIAVYTTGSIASEVLEAAKNLKEQGICITVVNVPTIKPFDEEQVLQMAKSHHTILTVEEHNIYGGLGSTIAEVLASHGCGCKLQRMGLKDCFAKGYGTHAQMRQMNGLDKQSVIDTIKSI